MYSIETNVYDIINNEFNIISNLMQFFESNNIEYSVIANPYPDMTGACLSVCWIEDGYLHHITSDIEL